MNKTLPQENTLYFWKCFNCLFDLLQRGSFFKNNLTVVFLSAVTNISDILYPSPTYLFKKFDSSQSREETDFTPLNSPSNLSCLCHTFEYDTLDLIPFS